MASPNNQVNHTNTLNDKQINKSGDAGVFSRAREKRKPKKPKPEGKGFQVSRKGISMNKKLIIKKKKEVLGPGNS